MTNRASRPAGTAPASRGGSGAARRKAAAFRAAEAARRRRVLRWGGSVAMVAAAITAIVVLALTRGGHRGSGGSAASSDTATATLTGPPGPEGIVLEEGTPLAPASTAATGQTVDGVECNSMEQAGYHIHTHLTVYVNGALRPIPPGIGVVEPVAQQSSHGTFDEASHYYWLHTHAQDGIIHVEAPSRATYTLGQFFGIWRQPLDPHQVGPATGGKITTYVNGKTYTGDPAAITLTSHEDIQIDIGTPTVAPRRVDWSHAQL